MADPTRGTSFQNSVGSGGIWVDKLVTAQGANYLIGGGSANTLTATLTSIVAGSLVTVATGLRVLLKNTQTLQVGANTFNLNAHGADPIKNIGGNNLRTAVIAGGMLDLVFDGTNWQLLNTLA